MEPIQIAKTYEELNNLLDEALKRIKNRKNKQELLKADDDQEIEER